MSRPWLPATGYEKNLLDRAARCRAYGSWMELTEESLREIASREGIDFATAIMFDRIRHSREHGPFIEQVESMPDDTATPPFPLGVTLAVVPGAFYVESPHTGADGAFVLETAQELGCWAELIPIASFGSLRQNARIIANWFDEHSDVEVIVVSLSKGGAEVKLALAESAPAFRNVTAWVNLCGIESGTPLAAWLLNQRLRCLLIKLLFWYRGHSFDVVRELRRGPGCLLDFSAPIPDHMQVIHVVGFPLERHMTTPLARRGYRRIAPQGPNDGGAILLSDVRRLTGLIYPVWGADHYMRPAWDVRILLRRLFRFLGEGRRQQATLPITAELSCLRPRSQAPAWERTACEALPRDQMPGRAWKAVRSQAEPGNEGCVSGGIL